MDHDLRKPLVSCLRDVLYQIFFAAFGLSALAWPCWAQQVKEFSPNDHPPVVGPGTAIKQPDVYWHDANLHLDLDTSRRPWGLLVQQESGSVYRVELPREIVDVEAIHRAGPKRAVLVADLNAGAHYVGIVDTNSPKLVDSFWTTNRLALSPDNRYVIFVRFYPSHGADNYDDQYRLYDVLGSRSSNWPERPAQDGPPTEPMNYDDTLAGIPVYSLRPGEVGLVNANVPEGEEHQSASSFLWSRDSSKVLFADVQGETISLVIVFMPIGGKGGPQTLVHPLVGTENVCLAGGDCDYKNVQSLSWGGESVDADLLFRSATGKTSELKLAIPLSNFVLADR